MSALSYNGIIIEMTRSQVTSAAEMSRDGMDQVGTKYTIDATGVFNPQATSYRAYTTSSGQVSQLSSDKGSNAPTTYEAVHALLNTNRGQLLFDYGDKRIVSSPKAGSGCDVAGGPTVKALTVVPMGDSRTFLVRIVIETTLDDCSQFLPTPNASPLASNRWLTTHRIGPDQLTTILTQGVAVFRLDSLEALQVPADHFRDIVLPTIPQGFTRELDVTVDPSGRVMAYSVTDQQMKYSLGSGNIPPDAKFRTPASLGVLRFQATHISSAVPFARGDSGVAIAGPMNTSALSVTAQGTLNSSRLNLIEFAVRLAVERLEIRPGIPAEIGGTHVRGVTVQELLHDQVVMVNIEVWRSFGDGQNKDNGFGLGILWKRYIGIDYLPRTFPNDANGMLPGGLNPQLPNDYNTRGLWSGEILAQALRGACGEPYLNNGCLVNLTPGNDNLKTCPVDIRVGQYPTQPPTPNPSRFTPESGRGVITDIRVTRTTLTDKIIKAAPVSGKSGGGGCPPGYGTELQIGGRAMCCKDTSGGDCVEKPAAGGGTGSTTDASDAPEVEIMTLASPMTMVSIEFTGERIGAKPIRPMPEDPTKKLVLLKSQIESQVPELLSDGQTVVYRISGRFDYIAKKSIDLDKESIYLGINPYCNLQPEECFTGPEDSFPGVGHNILG